MGSRLSYQLVEESDVGESSSDHDFVVSSASSVGVVVLLLDTSALEVLRSR